MQRAFGGVRGGDRPVRRLQTDAGLQSILEASLYSEDVLYAAIVDIRRPRDRRTAIRCPWVDKLRRRPRARTLLNSGPIAQARAMLRERSARPSSTGSRCFSDEGGDRVRIDPRRRLDAADPRAVRTRRCRRRSSRPRRDHRGDGRGDAAGANRRCGRFT